MAFTESGVYNIIILASDGVLADSETVQITVFDAGNQLPVLANIGVRSTTEGINLGFGVTTVQKNVGFNILTAATRIQFTL